jgi:serine/threonine protein kinase
LLGRGGMADVYDALDTRLQRRVAVKRLRPALAVDPAVRARFEREARAAARLNHPAVVGVYDIGEEGGVPYLVMERMPGQTLADRMAAGPLDQEWLRRTALHVLSALAAAHAAGILHRDIKPGNMLLGVDGGIKVADFGIAAVTDTATTDEHHTSTGLVIGTPAYLAPERVQGQPATVESDLYAVGVLLYEGLTGRKPYVGATPLATAAAAQQGDAQPVERFRPDADPRLVDAAARAMALRPEDRYPSAAAMAAALAGPPVSPVAATIALPLEEGTEPARPSAAKTVAALLGTVALATIAVVLWPFGGQKANPPESTPPTTSAPAPTTETTLTPPTSVAPVLFPTSTVPRPRHRHHGATSTSVPTDNSGNQ